MRMNSMRASMTWRGMVHLELDENAHVGVRGEENETLVSGHLERAERLGHAR